MKSKAAICIVLVSLFVVFPLVRGDWPMFHGDQAHTGVGKGAPVLTPTLLWKFTTGDSVNYSPVVANGIVYTSSYDGNLYALNARTGQKIWNYNASILGIGSSPTVADDIVYVGSGDQNRYLYAFDAYNGRLLWTAYVGASVTSEPTIVKGVMYLAANSIGNSPSCVLALDAKTGIEIWNYSSTKNLGCTPAVADGVVYIGSGDGYVHALDAKNGHEIWSTTREEAEFLTSPTVVNGVLYVGINGGRVGTDCFYALNATNGAELWKYSTSGPGNYVLTTAAVYEGTVYVGARSGDLYAFNAADGTLIWHIMAGHWLFSSPAVVQGIVYLGSGDGNFYAINGTDGTVLWTYPINTSPGNFVYSSPAYDHGALYIGTCDHNLYAFGAYTGPTPPIDWTTVTANPTAIPSPTQTLEPQTTTYQTSIDFQQNEGQPDNLALIIAVVITALLALIALAIVFRKR
jgi:eukaryotic-like serine/threonine-protein kinase